MKRLDDSLMLNNGIREKFIWSSKRRHIYSGNFSRISLLYYSNAGSHRMDQSGKAFAGIEYVFLDRDGVINCKPPEGKYVGRWDDFHPHRGAEEAIAALNASGRRVIVVTNQRGVALGLYSEEDVKQLHAELQCHLSNYSAHIDAFYYCPHDRNECNCRKPSTGLFEQAFLDFPSASPRNSIVIGDSISDIQAARRLSFPSIFITGDPLYRKAGAVQAGPLASAVAESLAEAVELYLT
jgi:D-glycero-D-manno-heptose 1,7-bisphosphate phosphatase